MWAKCSATTASQQSAQEQLALALLACIRALRVHFLSDCSSTPLDDSQTKSWLNKGTILIRYLLATVLQKSITLFPSYYSTGLKDCSSEHYLVPAHTDVESGQNWARIKPCTIGSPGPGLSMLSSSLRTTICLNHKYFFLVDRLFKKMQIL